MHMRLCTHANRATRIVSVAGTQAANGGTRIVSVCTRIVSGGPSGPYTHLSRGVALISFFGRGVDTLDKVSNTHAHV